MVATESTPPAISQKLPVGQCDGEQHDDQQGEEQHRYECVEGAQFDAQVLDEMSPERARSWPSWWLSWSPTIGNDEAVAMDGAPA